MTGAPVDVMFFSRGRGRGHAANDMAIAQELRRLNPRCAIEFASYDEGARTLRHAGEEVTDLDLPEANGFPETVVRCARLISQRKPHLIVAHEEPAALSAGKIFGVATSFLTHWFGPSSDQNIQALEHADTILFMENAGLFPEPRQVRGRVTYSGPLLRPIAANPSDRERIRDSLGLTPEDKFIAVLPGSSMEQVTPIFELVTKAYNQLSGNKRILWVAGRDHEELSRKVNNAHITFVSSCSNLHQIMIASDLAITKGTYNTGRELLALGVPTIVISHGHNYIDDLYARSFQNQYFLWATETTENMLKGMIENIISQMKTRVDLRSSTSQGLHAVAQALHLQLLKSFKCVKKDLTYYTPSQ